MPETLRGLAALRRVPLLQRLLKKADAGGQRVYLTGGYLRDRLLGRRPKGELDLTAADPAALLEGLPCAAGESFFLMDKERQTYRVVLPPSCPVRFLDVTRLRGPSIEEDLQRRDFTVNALAVELSLSGGRRTFLDPTGGRKDLDARILRACSTRAIGDDPLRALRGVRLSVNLGLRLERGTLVLMGKSRRALAGVSGERIRDEFFQILGGPAPVAGLRILLQLKLLEFLGPGFRSPADFSPVLTRRCLELLSHFPPGSLISRRLAGTLQAGVSRRAVLILGTLLTDGGSSEKTKRLRKRLVLGKCAEELLRAITERGLPRNWERDPRLIDDSGLLELFHCCDGSVVEITLLEACRITPAAIRSAAVRSFLRSYSRRRRRFLRPPLLTGRAALKHLSLDPGPELGEILRAVKRAQDLGTFRDREGAVAWARKHLSSEGK